MLLWNRCCRKQQFLYNIISCPTPRSPLDGTGGFTAVAERGLRLEIDSLRRKNAVLQRDCGVSKSNEVALTEQNLALQEKMRTMEVDNLVNLGKIISPREHVRLCGSFRLVLGLFGSSFDVVFDFLPTLSIFRSELIGMGNGVYMWVAVIQLLKGCVIESISFACWWQI